MPFTNLCALWLAPSCETLSVGPYADDINLTVDILCVQVDGPVAKALLTHPDLMPFLLRFSLLEKGCALGIALSKLAVKAMLSVNPPPGSGRAVPDDQFTLTVQSEVDPERPEDSLR